MGTTALLSWLDAWRRPAAPAVAWRDTSTLPARIGPFPIKRLIGSGSMGVVYLGHDVNCDRDVAIKTIRRDPQDDPSRGERVAARFRGEARAAGRLNHRNIVTLYGSDTDGEVEYLVMEYVRGHTLRACLRGGRPMPVAHVLCLMYQLLDALHYAHGRGIVHRDIKPSNLLVSDEGLLQITDFGVARDVQGSATTRSSWVVGTPGHMAPEQLTNGRVDRRADIFAAGVVLYELLTGRRPFGGDDHHATMYQIVYQAWRPLDPQAEAALLPFTAVFDRALAKQADDRYPTALEFRQALEALEPLAPEPVPALLPAASRLPPAGDGDPAGEPPEAVDDGAATDRRPRRREAGTRADAAADCGLRIQLRRRFAWSDFSDLRAFLTARWIYEEAALRALLRDESRCQIVRSDGSLPDPAEVDALVDAVEEDLFAALSGVEPFRRYLQLNGGTGRFSELAHRQAREFAATRSPPVAGPPTRGPTAPPGPLRGVDPATHRFGVALAFPESLRWQVRHVAAELERLLEPGELFYDTRFVDELAGRHGPSIVEDLFARRCRTLVLFAAPVPAGDEWCGLDAVAVRRLARGRAAAEVLVVVLDGREADGLVPGAPRVDARRLDAPDVAAHIVARLGGERR